VSSGWMPPESASRSRSDISKASWSIDTRRERRERISEDNEDGVSLERVLSRLSKKKVASYLSTLRESEPDLEQSRSESLWTYILRYERRKKHPRT
jgi:hypothetical protein